MQDSHTAGARERRNEKKTCFKCFRWVGKGALAVNLLACLLFLFFACVYSLVVWDGWEICYYYGFSNPMSPMVLCLTRYLLLS